MPVRSEEAGSGVSTTLHMVALAVATSFALYGLIRKTAQVEAPDRLRWLIREAVKTIDAGIGFGGFAALLTDDDPDFTKLFRRILAERRAGLHSVIDAGKADGSFRADLDGATLVDAMVGAHVYERARTGRVASGSETRLFDLFWPVVQKRPR